MNVTLKSETGDIYEALLLVEAADFTDLSQGQAV